MIHQDTIKLLRECDAGIKMGIGSIQDVLDHVRHPEFRTALTQCRDAHEALQEKLQSALDRFGDDGKEPNPIARSMSWMKTNLKLNMDDSDHVIADLMTDGCDMGVKSLSRYLNQYKAADEDAKDIAKSLIRLEAKLGEDIRPWL